MALLDRRLIPLIETLTDARLDWLAFELVDGIRRGHETEETTGTLAEARERARKGEGAAQRAEAADIQVSKPLVGDEQVDWAVKYIGERLDATVAEMATALSNLDLIATGNGSGISRSDHVVAKLVLKTEDQDWAVGRENIEAARAALPQLRQVLVTWRDQVRPVSDT